MKNNGGKGLTLEAVSQIEETILKVSWLSPSLPSPPPPKKKKFWVDVNYLAYLVCWVVVTS